MAKQIIWSPLAKEALKDLLISSQERDGNKRCGGTLYTLFQNALYRVTLNPFIGQPTEALNISSESSELFIRNIRTFRQNRRNFPSKCPPFRLLKWRIKSAKHWFRRVNPKLWLMK